MLSSLDDAFKLLVCVKVFEKGPRAGLTLPLHGQHELLIIFKFRVLDKPRQDMHKCSLNAYGGTYSVLDDDFKFEKAYYGQSKQTLEQIRHEYHISLPD